MTDATWTTTASAAANRKLINVVMGKRSSRLSFETCWATICCNNLILHLPSEDTTNRTPQHVTVIPLSWNNVSYLQEENQIRIKRSRLPDLFITRSTVDDTEAWFPSLLNASTMRRVEENEFEKIREIGKGKFGSIFLARHRATGETLAMKYINKRSMHRQQALEERLILEMGAVHPFTLGLKYSFQTRTHLCLVTEFCAAGDLSKFIPDHSPLPENTVRRIAAEVLLGLEYLHSLGVMYRDLKPQNILLDGAGHVRLGDFGYSKILCQVGNRVRDSTLFEEDIEELRPRAITTCGTPLYMAPEMWRPGLSYDQHVDMWAFGVLLYELLCGYRPFEGDTYPEVANEVKFRPLGFPPGMSSASVGLISALLDKDARTRLGTGREGISEIKASPFFAGVDWNELVACEGHPDDLVGTMQFAALKNTIEYGPPAEEEDNTARCVPCAVFCLPFRPRYDDLPGYDYSTEQEK